jgi:patatin-like phospholipase/acyl hydrolase
MGTASVREDLSPNESEKAVQWESKIDIIGSARISRPYGHVHRPSYVSEQQIHRDEPLEGNYTPITEPSIATLDDDGPWAKKTILCLDGGGVRGYSSLLILRALMKEIEALEHSADRNAISSAYSPLVDSPPEKSLDPTSKDNKTNPEYLPCHYFDYIAGTSTGGLIAILLGRLRMSVDKAIEEYEMLSAKVFEAPPSRLKRSLTKYNSIARWETLRKHFESMRPMRPSYFEKSHHFKSDPFRCRTIVCSIKSTKNKDFQTPFLFRSYDHIKNPVSPNIILERNPSDSHTFDIWQVARATSAAPLFFKSISLFDDRYYDAAEDINNPSLEVVNEISLISRGSHDAIDVLLSIGGGNAHGNMPKTKFGGGGLLQEMTAISAVVHEKVRSESKAHFFAYYRLDVEEGLQDVGLNEWKPKSSGARTIERIKHATDRYLGRADVRSQCHQCAAALVRKRTQRAQTMLWECFATGTRYKCPEKECPSPNERYQNRNSLMDHLRMQHDYAPPDAEHFEEMQTLLDKGRTSSD